MKLIFVAGPYRAKTAWGIEQNVRRAEEIGLEVSRRGHMPVIPHANTRFFQGEGSDEFWLLGTQLLLARCDAIIMIPGWQDSSGSIAEMELATSLGMHVYYDVSEIL